MKTKEQILGEMSLFRVSGGGIGSWLTEKTCDDVFKRLGVLDEQPLPAVQLNQLLVLAHEAPVSDGFFRYYWLDAPHLHPYSVWALPGFRSDWTKASAIQSLGHLAWGLYRLYVDALLYFGNVRTAFRTLREFSHPELSQFFCEKRIDTEAIKRRGPPLPLRSIDKDKRYLISEMACKSYGEDPQRASDLRLALVKGLAAHTADGGQTITIRALLENRLPSEFKERQRELTFSASEILDAEIRVEHDLDRHYRVIAERFSDARRDALENTRYYLSMLTDLDVYVATSMRDREHFIKMAFACDSVFSDPRLQALNLRYFDPTLSAASGHEDKGLIECLMVKCAKALVYCGGDKESYGKDAEAAMALTLGRPVVFYCEERAQFYREVHPLTRLIQFETGVAVGAMVTDDLNEVAELLYRTFENKMAYQLEQSESGSLRLKEEVTGSVVRLQTSDELLSETFWNHYHLDKSKRSPRALRLPMPSFEQAVPSATAPEKQGELLLEETEDLLPLAARRVVSPKQERISHARVAQSGPRTSDASFPLSIGEIFDAISRSKRTQTTGAKRYETFLEWLTTEGVDTLEGVKLLRFIEATLDMSGARPSFVYKHAHLTRWYREMSAGEMAGTMR